MTPHRLSFVIASRNEDPAVVAATIYGLLATSHGYWREILVVDDASILPFSFQHPEVAVLRNPEPLGACRSRRRGCAAATGDVVVGLDAHMSFAPGWLEAMLPYVDSQALLCPPWRSYRHETIHAVGSNMLWRSERHYARKVHPGIHYDPRPPSGETGAITVPMVIGACYMMRRDAYESIGGWNPHFSIYGSEEQDLSLRAWLAGLSVQCVTDARVGHLSRGEKGTPYKIEWAHFEHNQAVMLRTLFEPATSALLEQYLWPLPSQVEAALGKLDLADWREAIQRHRKMDDAELFARFLPGAPIEFSHRKARLKTGERTPQERHLTTAAEEDALWNDRTALPKPGLHREARARVDATVSVRAFGQTVSVTTADRKWLPQIRSAFAEDWIDVIADTADLAYTVSAEGVLATSSRVLGGDALPELLAASLRSEMVARSEHLFVDAAVVGIEGRGVLILGDRYSGRLALLVELLKVGATYYSHALAPIDEHGRVLPFAQPLAFAQPHGVPAKQWETAELVCGRDPLRVGLVVNAALHRSEHWAPKVLSSGATVLRLFGSAVNARSLGDRAFARLCLAASIGLEGARGVGAAAVATSILRQLA